MTKKPTAILVVDDEPTMRRVMRARISMEGYHCEEAASADEAIDRLASNPAALVFLDIKMPGKSGLELLPEIRSRYPDTAVVMTTAIDETSIAIECMKAGAYDFLMKPFNLDEVIHCMARALAKRNLELENREYRIALQRQLNALNNLFQTHIKVRQETEEAYARLVREITGINDKLQTLLSEAQAQLSELELSPGERVPQSRTSERLK